MIVPTGARRALGTPSVSPRVRARPLSNNLCPFAFKACGNSNDVGVNLGPYSAEICRLRFAEGSEFEEGLRFPTVTGIGVPCSANARSCHARTSHGPSKQAAAPSPTSLLLPLPLPLLLVLLLLLLLLLRRLLLRRLLLPLLQRLFLLLLQHYYKYSDRN